MLAPSPAWAACAWAARDVLPAQLNRLTPLNLCRAQVMEFDRVVFNEEPGAVYGPGATPLSLIHI